MAVFILMCHGLVQEGWIQGKSGIHPLKATLVRIGAATVTVLLMAPWVGSSTLMHARARAVRRSIPHSWRCSVTGAGPLQYVPQDLLHHHGPPHAARAAQNLRLDPPPDPVLSPFLRFMGLDQKVGFLWLTAVIFGLSYGGAIIVEEAKSGHLSRQDLEVLHLSIGSTTRWSMIRRSS